VLRHRPLPLPPAAPLPDGAYLVIGDASGNAAAVARFVGRRPGARLALLADAAEASPAESAQARQRAERQVAALGAAGAEVLMLRADLADPAAVARAVRMAEERFGPLAGVFHAAGTYGERTFRVLGETGAEEAGWQLRPKVGALYALDAALTGRTATRRVLVSSLATAVGGFAYGAYVAASLAADALAEELGRRVVAQEQRGAAWLAVDLDVWELPGEREQITGLSPDLAALAMSEREGEEVLARAFASAETGRLLVSTEDLGVRLARRREQTAARVERRSASSAAHPRPELATPFAAPESELERRIAGAWQALLGFERVGLDDNFFELGGDSFVAVQAAARLQEELGVELPVARLYEGLTVRSLAALLATAEDGERRRVEHLEERRRSMDRRKRFQQQRRERAAGEPAHETDERNDSARRTSEGSV
jgi:acyl carrier protein/NADP-dependent 3-hydroxy acid dehydrogenase YdfG